MRIGPLKGQSSKREADRYHGFIRGLWIGLLGVRVLQNVVGEIVDQPGWPDTYEVECIVGQATG